jgi:hypothetical protein
MSFVPGTGVAPVTGTIWGVEQDDPIMLKIAMIGSIFRNDLFMLMISITPACEIFH